MAITTATAYKTFTGSTLSDGIVTTALSAAQDAMERYCGRAFEQATYTDEAYDGVGRDRIVLRNTPVTAVSAVKVRVTVGTTHTVSSSSYTFNGASGVLVRLAGEWDTVGLENREVWPLGFQNILVTYTAGYATVPDDIVMACWRVASSLLAQRGRDPALLSESDGLYSYQMAASAIERDAMVLSVLKPLRRPVL